ncbi:NAD(P)/FAD-dependent oxidoreductase [Haloechinothrix sp. YIM 98757]|uniref:NAD(P)/FAD-dependent oxidoreductase n=1 Tax=Haloechinothrix aidingensis TaxID=2752311 RepID=A0A838ABA0_9PSEU|nr:FAD/NAD(P)-binding oxidoreductase [Haloechinothrix aidingensis]MBA0126532.1 NAD(P)/FAD-dependent oxidoreductase [Haloechinothrix aidingensis]
MSTSRLVVVGASLAGLRAVEAARRTGYDGPLTLVGAEPHLPYDRPPLSKEFLAPAPQPPEPPTHRAEHSLRAELDVDLRLGTAATGVDTAARVLHLDDGRLPYTGLIIATGATARQLPNTPELAGVHTLRTVEDAHRVRAELDAGARNVVVVGAGFIGSEVAAAVRKRGLPVTVVEMAPVPLVRAIGEQMGSACARLHERHGTDLRCGVGVAGLEAGEGTDRVERVRLTDGSTLDADVVVVGTGAAPATGWLAGSGLEIDDGVVCDETLATGAPGVYAAGDVARWTNPAFGERMRLEHWTTTAEQGAAAARNALRPVEAQPFETVPYFWSDWYEHRLQFIGVPTAEEVRVVTGDTDSESFLALYRQGDRVVGALGLNERKLVMKFRRLIATRTSWRDGLDYVEGTR